MNTPRLLSFRPGLSRLGFTAVLAVMVSLLWVAAPAQACPNCRTILSDNESSEQLTPEQEQAIAMARGISWSVLVMMAMPFTLAGGMGLGLWYAIRIVNANRPPTSAN